jgi:hypothetical protein
VPARYLRCSNSMKTKAGHPPRVSGCI